MEVIAGSAVAGLIAALTATIILGAAKWIYLTCSVLTSSKWKC